LNNLVGTMPMVNRGIDTPYNRFTWSLIMYDSGTAGEPLVRIMWSDTTLNGGTYTEKKYAFAADTWYHIAGTLTEGASDNIHTGRLYITQAGVEEAVYQKGSTFTSNYSMLQGSSYPANLFQIDNHIDTNYFPGTMDEVAIFNYAKDASEFTTLLTALLEGDANRDGVVSAGDYASVQSNFGHTGDRGIPGDANGDGVVSAGDYASVQANFGSVAPSLTPVPEPASMCILSLGLVALIKRRK
jgi:hypothetical protein